jgi:peptidoglycan/LPS O-acetylase OafA/YrhL
VENNHEISENQRSYRPEIDGLRAIAVLAVLIFHAGLGWARCGYFGVDVFFVISGFLITSNIEKEIALDKWSLVGFYEKRIRRIVPALFSVLCICTAISWLFVSTQDLIFYSRSMIATLLFGSNFFFEHAIDYFHPNGAAIPLLHTWSLAVEEQFYLLYPLLLFFLRPLSRQARKQVILGLIFISLLYFIIFQYRLGTSMFYSPLSRAWEILLGALVYYLDGKSFSTGSFRLRQALSFLGLFLILTSVFGIYENADGFSLWAFFPVSGACLILYSSDPRITVNKILSYPVLTGIGLISYSLYLWHQPVFAYATIFFGPHSFAVAWGLVLFALAIATVSWKFVEQPFRKRDFWTRKQIFTRFAGLSIMLLVAGLVGKKFGDVRLLYSRADYGPLESPLGFDANPELHSGCFLQFAEQTASDFDFKKCVPEPGKRKRILLIGDSHAASLANPLKNYFANKDVDVATLTVAYCIPFVEHFSNTDAQVTNQRCQKINSRLTDLATSGKFDLVILSAFYLEWGDRQSQSPSYHSFWADFRKTLIDYQTHGSHLVLLGQFPLWTKSLPELLFLESRNPLRVVPTFSPADLDMSAIATDKKLSSIAAELEIPFISLTANLCRPNGCRRMVSRNQRSVPIAFDYGHLSEPGGEFILEQFLGPQLLKILLSNGKD